MGNYMGNYKIIVILLNDNYTHYALLHNKRKYNE